MATTTALDFPQLQKYNNCYYDAMRVSCEILFTPFPQSSPEHVPKWMEISSMATSDKAVDPRIPSSTI